MIGMTPAMLVLTYRCRQKLEEILVKTLILAVAICPALAVAQSAPLLYDAEGTLLGLSVDPKAIVSHRGYRFQIAETGAVSAEQIQDATGRIFSSKLFYIAADCSGQGYLTTDLSGGIAGGIVIRFQDEPPMYAYVPKAVSVSQYDFASSRDANGSCRADQAQRQATEAYPNDPSETGVPNVPFIPPFRLEMEPYGALFRLMKDGFESSFFADSSRSIFSSST